MKNKPPRVYTAGLSVWMLIMVLTGTAQKSAVYSVADFGAKGDGRTINTKSINAAIQIK